MRRCSMAILNLGGSATATAGDGVFPNPNRRTPDHPPYSEMVSVALQALAEENGSTESSISSFIQSTFNDLPWGHDRLLPYYLRKLVVDGELTSPSPFRYQLSLQPPPSFSSPIRRRGRPRLYSPNPNPNPKPSRLPSAFPRRRGRPRKVLAEDMSPPGRGRSRLRRGGSMGRRYRRGSGFGSASSRGSKRRKDSNVEKLNYQSENSAFFESDVSKGEFLGEEAPLLLLDPGTVGPCLAPAQYGLVEGQTRLGEELPCLAPEQMEFSQDQSMLGGKLPLLTPEQGKPLHFLGSEVFDHDHGQSMQDAAPPFMPLEKMRGRSRLRRGASVGRRSGLRLPSSRGSKRRKDRIPVRNIEKLNCQSENSAFFNYIKNGGPEQSDGSKGQFLGEEAPFLHLDPGTMPPGLASEQGKPLPFLASNQSMQEAAPPFMPPKQTECVQLLRRGASIGRTHTRRSGFPLPSSRGSKRRKDSNIERLNCQLENTAFFNDVKNGGSECAVLEQGQFFVSPELPDVSKGQFLIGEAPLLLLDPGTMTPCLASEHYELVEGQPLLGEKPPCLAPEETEFSHDQSMLGEKLPLLIPEQGKPLPFSASKVFEHGHDQSMQEAAPPFTPPEQMRGTSRLRQGASIGHTHTRRSGLRLPSSRGSKRRKDRTPENSAFFNDIKNGGSECVVLEQGQPFVSPEQSDVNKAQFLGTIPPFLAPEHCELVEGQSMLGEKLPFLTPEQGKPLTFLDSKAFEHDHGLSMQEAAPPFMPPKQTEPVQLPREKLPFFTPKSGKVQPFLPPELAKHDHGQEGAPPFVSPEQTGHVPSSPSERPPIPPFLAPEFLEHDQGQASKGEEPLFMSPEQTELVRKQHEHSHGFPLAPSEESEDGHDQRLVGIGAADLKGEELVLMPRPDEEEVENAPVSSRRSKLYGKRRSLRLWFES